MGPLVLVVDANSAFATMLQQALQEQAACRVTLASTAAEAVEQAAQSDFDLAIVDMDLPDVPGADAVRALRATRPQLAVIAIPVDGDPADPALQALDLQGFLSKPFFLPSLGDAVAEALARPVGGVARSRPQTDTAPEPSTARAAVEEDGPPEPAPAFDWLADPAEAARRLAGAAQAAAAEAGLLVRRGRILARAGEFSDDEFELLAGILQSNAVGERRGGQSALMRFVRLPSSGQERLLYATALAAELALALLFHTDHPMGLIRRHARHAADSLLQPEAARPAQPAPPAARPAVRPAARPPRPSVETRTQAPEWLPAPGPEPPSGFAAAAPRALIVDPGLELPPDTELGGLARTPHALYNLTYSVVWAPKFPKTRLAGNIAGLLDEWIRHIALSYDWRVEQVQVRPECVVVVVNCSPETAPERLVTTFKRLTSDRTFGEFPSLAADHPGGDFWAPGYLLQGGAQALTPQQIVDFLAYTRREQGLRR